MLTRPIRYLYWYPPSIYILFATRKKSKSRHISNCPNFPRSRYTKNIQRNQISLFLQGSSDIRSLGSKRNGNVFPYPAPSHGRRKGCPKIGLLLSAVKRKGEGRGGMGRDWITRTVVQSAFVVRVSSSRREISVETGSFVRRAATTKRARERGEARRRVIKNRENGRTAACRCFASLAKLDYFSQPAPTLENGRGGKNCRFRGVLLPSSSLFHRFFQRLKYSFA